MVEFTKKVEQNTPKFKKKYHTWLAQPIKDQIGYSDELLWSIIDSTYWTKKKENVFQIINQETWEIEKEFYWSIHKIIYEEIKSYKKRTNNIWIIGHIDLWNSNTVKILSKYLLKWIPKHKIATDSSGNKVYQAVTRRSEVLKIKNPKKNNQN